jgi:hypothetical protein
MAQSTGHRAQGTGRDAQVSTEASAKVESKGLGAWGPERRTQGKTKKFPL